MTRRASLLAVALVLGCLAACSRSGSPAKHTSSELRDNTGSGSFQGEVFHPAQPRPSFALTDDSGKPFDFASITAKHPTLLYFGYTHCPDACPQTMGDAHVAVSHIPASVARNTYVVFVTTDVKRDTGPVIKQWLSNFSAGTKAHWIGLRGTQAQIDQAQAAAHVNVAEDEGQTHSTQLLLYGPDNYAHVFYLDSNNESKQIAHDLPLVAAGHTT